MLAQEVVCSDDFQELSHSAQALYFQFNLKGADDEGIIGNWKGIVRMARCDETDVDELICARFLLQVDQVLVVKHWLIHNTIPKKRVIPTTYLEQRNKIRIKTNKAYTDNLNHEDLLTDSYDSTLLYDDVDEHISFVEKMEDSEPFNNIFINTHRIVNQNCREADKIKFRQRFGHYINSIEGEEL